MVSGRFEGGHEPHWVDMAISRLLRGGVVISIAVVIAGLILTFVHHPEYLSSKPALVELTAVAESFPHTLADVWKGLTQMRGQALVALGLLLLIATPVARVALSIIIFAIEKDRFYVAITVTVLLLLIASFVLGAAG
jgi:uncharacterized membrane protein